jgi:hypothetical protein
MAGSRVEQDREGGEKELGGGGGTPGMNFAGVGWVGGVQVFTPEGGL